ncbi:MAG: hypothetical protein AAF517_20520 [Planctomycetota bacterium]
MRLTRWTALLAVVCFGLVGVTSVSAQGSADSRAVNIPDVQVEPSGTFDPVVEVDTTKLDDPMGLHLALVHLITPGQTVRVENWSIGAGLQQHMDEHGEPPRCDVEIMDEGIMGGMFLAHPYDSEVYGTEWLVFHCRVLTDASTTVELPVHIETNAGAYDFEVTVDVKPSISQVAFLRGDVNDDARCDIADSISVLQYLFQGGPEPNCEDSADIDDNGRILINDAVLILSALFQGGTEMPETCEADITEDALGCASSASGCS